MDFLKYTTKNILFFVVGIFFLSFLSSCGGIGNIWDPADARTTPSNVNERVQKNLEEGKGFSLNKAAKEGKSGGSYQFSTSNSMWRATLEILDFLPLANVDYSGGIITTDWYNEGTAADESIKITVRFLTNEIRSDGLKIIVHKRKCNAQQNCVVKKISSALERELQMAILRKAVVFQEEVKKGNKKKYKRLKSQKAVQE